MAEHAIGPHAYVPYFAEKGKYPGVLGWLLATDHKRIGLLYLFSVITFFFVAVFIGVLMRINMIPGHPIMTAQQYNAMFFSFMASAGVSWSSTETHSTFGAKAGLSE